MRQKKVLKKLASSVEILKDVYKYFKKELFYLIVGDLPYGLRGNTSSTKNASFTKNPSDLLSVSISEWEKEELQLWHGILIL